ncbi:hypothetical protein [Massilia pseudoviolaceinigra]|uniref:hypothetical protein n=1 Tax=Massilia pseudoviolaceinigra TaxID=3057165 RepID=UPI002796674B|nr:hypothetical protein [Massilia sp. CCM 9206]MDQ1920985.1 hypothetical protein [Massilia sp. CCM 9206]
MHYLLIIGAFLLFAFMAPPMVTLATIGAFGLVAMVGARTVKAVTGAQVGWDKVLQSVALAFVFSGVALAGMMSLFGSVNLVLLLVALLIAYISGFRIGLGIDFKAAAIVALITSLMSAVLFWLVKTII